MESKRKIVWAAAAVMTAMLGACSSIPKEETPKLAQKMALGIAQVGSANTVRYVYCQEPDCERPTKKTMPTPARQLPVASSTTSDEAVIDATVTVGFAFNSSELTKADTEKLLHAAPAGPSKVEITARSDYIGPATGQQKIVKARAEAIKKIVAQQTRGAHIVEHQEIAGPDRVDADRQAQQRRGTVRFIQITSIVSPKGITQ